MSEEPITLYKLIVLYMLNRVSFPLTTAQISNFLLEKGYTNFFTLSQVIHELTEAGMIHSKTQFNRTHLSLTEEGRRTLLFFENRINDTIREEIDDYLNENELTLRNEVSVQSDYYKAVSGEYEAHLSVWDKGVKVVELTLSVPLEEMAVSICDNWQSKNQEIYLYLTQQLF